MTGMESDLDRLEDLLRQFADERGLIETAASAAQHAADALQRSASSAKEAAGWIAHEAARLRR